MYVTITRQLITTKVTALDATPDCGRLVSARGMENGTLVEVWDSAGNKPTHSFHVPFVILDFVKLGRDNRHVAYGAFRGIKFRDLTSEKDVDLDAGSRAEIFGRGAVQATREDGGGILLRWSLSGKRSARWTEVPPGEIVIHTSHPARLLLKRDEKTLVVWDPSQQRESFTIPVCLSHDRKTVHAAACSRFNWLALDDGRLTVYDMQSGEILWQRVPGSPPHVGVTAMQATADGRHLVTATRDSVIRVWRIVDGARLAAFPCDSRISQLLVRGNRLFVGTLLGTLYSLEFEDLCMGQPLLEIWRDEMGGFFGNCPQCGWQGRWDVESTPGRSRCPSCQAEFDV